MTKKAPTAERKKQNEARGRCSSDDVSRSLRVFWNGKFRRKEDCVVRSKYSLTHIIRNFPTFITVKFSKIINLLENCNCKEY